MFIFTLVSLLRRVAGAAYRPRRSQNTSRSTATSDKCPLYFQELICPYRPTRSLRSESKNLLYVPACRTATYGNRLFTVETATLCNDLPQEVRDAENLSSFKRLLKTHLFNSAFSQNCLKLKLLCGPNEGYMK